LSTGSLYSFFGAYFEISENNFARRRYSTMSRMANAAKKNTVK